MAPDVQAGTPGQGTGRKGPAPAAGAFRRARVPAGWLALPGRRWTERPPGSAWRRTVAKRQAVQRDGVNGPRHAAAVGRWLVAVHRAWRPPPAPRRKSPGTRRTVTPAVRHSLIIYVHRGPQAPAYRPTRGRSGCPPASRGQARRALRTRRPQSTSTGWACASRFRARRTYRRQAPRSALPSGRSRAGRSGPPPGRMQRRLWRRGARAGVKNEHKAAGLRGASRPGAPRHPHTRRLRAVLRQGGIRPRQRRKVLGS